MYSQYNEAEIINNLLKALKKRSEDITCCEFGAWDGYRFSNIVHLVEKGSKALLIESNTKRFNLLQKNMSIYKCVKCVNLLVTEFGSNSLESILGKNGFAHLDVLSIDIDSDDAKIFKTLKTIQPEILVIEYNPNIPNDINIENPDGKMLGSSALCLLEIAKEKDYFLVSQTPTNLIFMKNKYKIRLPDKLIQKKLKFVNGNFRFFFGYDGALYRYGYKNGILDSPEVMKVPWNSSIFAQPVPVFFRTHSDSFFTNKLRMIYSFFYVCFTSPISFLRRLLKI